MIIHDIHRNGLQTEKYRLKIMSCLSFFTFLIRECFHIMSLVSGCVHEGQYSVI